MPFAVAYEKVTGRPGVELSVTLIDAAPSDSETARSATDAVSVSSSSIVAVAAVVSIVTPAGSPASHKCMEKASSVSTIASWVVCTVIVFDVSPGANVSEFTAPAKSWSEAVPSAVIHQTVASFPAAVDNVTVKLAASPSSTASDGPEIDTVALSSS